MQTTEDDHYFSFKRKAVTGPLTSGPTLLLSQPSSFFFDSGPPAHQPCLLSGGLPDGGYQMTQLEHHSCPPTGERGRCCTLFFSFEEVSLHLSDKCLQARQGVSREFACKEKEKERRKKVPFRQRFSFGQTMICPSSQTETTGLNLKASFSSHGYHVQLGNQSGIQMVSLPEKAYLLLSGC